ncbi:MAG: DivIVA domain-containing protein [Acidimicrobiales bacterium]
MDSSPPTQPPQSILETLRTVEFRLGLKGYNVDEVDEYLEKAAVEAEGLQEQSRQLMERLRQASDRIAQLEAERRDVQATAAAPAPSADAGMADETLQRTLVLAQKFVDQAKRESENEAAAVVAQAREQARILVVEAEEHARRTATESEQRLRDEVGRLESMRGQLASDVENMARHLESERNRLHSTLSEVLKWVDDNIQPANSLMALRPRGTDPVRGGGPSPARPAPSPHPQAGVGAQAHGAVAADTVAQVLDLRGSPAGGGSPADRA